jgi:hypothetical protein
MHHDALVKELGRLNPTIITLHRWLKDEDDRDVSDARTDEVLVLDLEDTTASTRPSDISDVFSLRSPGGSSADVSLSLDVPSPAPPSIAQQSPLIDGFKAVCGGKANIVETHPGHVVLFC